MIKIFAIERTELHLWNMSFITMKSGDNWTDQSVRYLWRSVISLFAWWRLQFCLKSTCELNLLLRLHGTKSQDCCLLEFCVQYSHNNLLDISKTILTFQAKFQFFLLPVEDKSPAELCSGEWSQIISCF